MTKKEFITLANERGLTDIRYSGKRNTFYIGYGIAAVTAFIAFIKNTASNFKVEFVDEPVTYHYKGLKRGYRKWGKAKTTILDSGVIFSNK